MPPCLTCMRPEALSLPRAVLLRLTSRRPYWALSGRENALEIKWLLDFLSLVDTRNFSRSADERATTQPAFSRRIKALEEWIGATLFDRGQHPIELTAAGQRFRPVAEEVLRRLLQSREEIRQIGENTESTISFAATHSLSLVFFPSWIRRIERDTGILRTRLESNKIGTCVQALMRGECHFMLSPTHSSVEMQLPEDRFSSVAVGEDRLLPVSAPEEDGEPIHALPGSKDRPVDYLAYIGSAASGQAVDFLLKHHDQAPVLQRVFDSHMAGVLKSMAVQGRGVAWLPESEILPELETGALVLAGPETYIIPSEIRLFRSLEPLPRAAEEFWQRMVDAGSASA
ncbi:MAG: LysR family transcriptional regulator [Rhodobacteraceae bacterium]|nr:MAG: LysR family transcriptional regulator [Paracoccaceae bacterium]